MGHHRRSDRRARRALALLGACLALSLAFAGPAAAAAPNGALLAFLPPDPHAAAPAGAGAAIPGAQDALGYRLAATPGLALGLLSATHGVYTTSQLLLDLGQGARVAYGAYSPMFSPRLTVSVDGAGAQVWPWDAVLRRARGAPDDLRPGLLAGSIVGGGAYVGVDGQSDEDAVAAADAAGHVAAYSSGPPATLDARLAQARAAHRFVVVDLPPGADGVAALGRLSTARAPGDALIVLERAPDEARHELLWAGAAGLSGGGRELGSDTTRLPGLSAATDIGPTVLRQLGLPVPARMSGQVMHARGASAHPTRLRKLRRRLLVLYGRRLPTLWLLLLGWLALAAAGLVAGRVRGNARPLRFALRAGALAILWAPVAVLVSAALDPSRAAEQAIVCGLCLLLGAVTDRLLRWPRAPLAPALVSTLALTADAVAGTQLLSRSLLGPNPSFGARFYGIGNELKSALAVLVLAGVAAALYPALRSRRAAAIFALAGIGLGVIVGAARLGAGVGGVVLVSAGTAIAVLAMLPGALTRSRAVALVLAPVIALAALAAIDLATAHGGGHYTRSVLHAHSLNDLGNIVDRRYAAAWDALRNGWMPVASGLALALLLWPARDRRLLRRLPDQGWRAAFAGGAAAGVVGALTEDSGPVLLVVAVFVLACLAVYLVAAPPRPRASEITGPALSSTTRPRPTTSSSSPGAHSAI